MNNRPLFALIGFLIFLGIIIALIPYPQGTVTILDEEIEIIFIKDGSAKAPSENETVALRTER